MKLNKISTFVLLAFLILAVSCNQQSKKQQNSTKVEADNKSEVVEPQPEKMLAEVACGECQFDLEGVGCDLAIRINGEAYFVDSIGIDDLGDAHADEGLCNAIRNANVEGYLKDDRFIATSIKLLPVEEK